MHFAQDLRWLTYALPPLSRDADILEMRYGERRAAVSAAQSPGSLVFCDLARRNGAAIAVGPLPANNSTVAGGGKSMPQDLPASAFDLVILHGTLDRSPSHADREASLGRDEMLAIAYRSLRPGGLIAVSGFNLLHPRSMRAFLARKIKRLFRSAHASQWQASDTHRPLTYWGYIRCLRRAGYRNVHVFNVIPDYRRPQHVVSAQREASAAYFRNVIEVRRASLSYPRYLFRRLLLHLNAFPYVERCYLIVAQK